MQIVIKQWDDMASSQNWTSKQNNKDS